MKAYKTEIKPNKKQLELIHQTFGNTRYIYNQFISYNFKRLENNQPIMSGYDYSKMINNDPNRPDWLIKSSSKAIKQAIMNAHNAIWDYLKGKKGKPNFKKKTKNKSDSRYKNFNFEFNAERAAKVRELTKPSNAVVEDEDDVDLSIKQACFENIIRKMTEQNKGMER